MENDRLMTELPALSRSEQKRRLILDVGRELFLAQGYADTSMDQVTARSGVSKATLYNHFPSKEKLFEEAVRGRAAEIFDALPVLDPQHTDPEDMLTRYFFTLLQILLSEEGSCMCYLLMSEGRRFPENARLIYETGFGRGLQEMATYLRGLHALGRLHVADPPWAAGRLLSIVLPPLQMLCAGFDPPGAPTIEEVRRSVRFFLAGVNGTT